MAARTVEVGRAVLSCSTHDLELWLTTLITVLPLQRSIDSQQLSSCDFLRLLSSGDVWVGCGNGMRVELELNLRSEHPPRQIYQELVQSIVSAPVWRQLNLEASLPPDAVPDGKVVSLNIGRAHETSSEEVKYHRILCCVPSADIQPTAGVSKYYLQLVRFSMDLLEAKKRPPLKRSKTSPVEGSHFQTHNDTDVESDEDSGSMLHELMATASTDSLRELGEVCDLNTPPGKRKRRTRRAHAAMRAHSSPLDPTHHNANSLKCSVEAITPSSRAQVTVSSSDSERVKELVDGAMRLSIYGLNKASTGLKVKANTFAAGLADVAPALWRPGYLAAISQRANLFSTISRSISQLHGRRVMSVSLSDKIRSLTRLDLEGDSISVQELSIVSRYLWQRVQRSLLNRPCTPIQAFVACNTDTPTPSDSDEILHEQPLDDFAAPDELCRSNGETASFTTSTAALSVSTPRQSYTHTSVAKADQILLHECNDVHSVAKSDLPVDMPYGFEQMVSGQRHTFPLRKKRESQDIAGHNVEITPTDYTATVQAVQGHHCRVTGTDLHELADACQQSREDLRFHSHERGNEIIVSDFVSLEDATNVVLVEPLEDW